MEADAVRHDLGAIHASVKAIKQRMEMILNPSPKEQNHKEQNKEER
jgi:K+/H+ antiporter YhaU regulatory subunit KhtT